MAVRLSFLGLWPLLCCYEAGNTGIAAFYANRAKQARAINRLSLNMASEEMSETIWLYFGGKKPQPKYLLYYNNLLQEP